MAYLDDEDKDRDHPNEPILMILCHEDDIEYERHAHETCKLNTVISTSISVSIAYGSYHLQRLDARGSLLCIYTKEKYRQVIGWGSKRGNDE